MFDKKRAAIGAVGVLTYVGVVMKLRHDRYLLAKKYLSLDSQMGYLIDVLNRHDVSLDAFDLMALPNVLQKERESH
jgi:hypothetical protein